MRTIDQPAPLEKTGDSTRPRRVALERLYTGKSLLQLFMVCAFPLHLWTLLMAFRDFGWVALRTTAWDALGLVAYSLAVALVETVVVFALLLLLGLLVPWSWPAGKRAALLGTLSLLLAAWSIFSKLFSLNGYPIPEGVLQALRLGGHPLRILWGVVFPLVAASIILPVITFVRSRRFQESLPGVFDRLVVLSSFYIFLDFLGLLIILVRNFHAGRGA